MLKNNSTIINKLEFEFQGYYITGTVSADRIATRNLLYLKLSREGLGKQYDTVGGDRIISRISLWRRVCAEIFTMSLLLPLDVSYEKILQEAYRKIAEKIVFTLFYIEIEDLALLFDMEPNTTSFTQT